MSRQSLSVLGVESRKPLALWEFVAKALDNERALDLRYRASYTTLPQGGPVPNFKVMKQMALQQQLGRFYPLLIAAAPLAILLAAPCQWLALLISATLCSKAPRSANACMVFSTTEDKKAIIDSALDSDPRIALLPRYPIRLSLLALGGELGWSGCKSVLCGHLHLLKNTLTRPAEERRDLLMHAYDALALLGLASIASQVGGIFVTDDHYQRWAYVLSQVAKDFRIVQHGFLDDELLLPCAGGSVSCLYIRDILFLNSFERYYDVDEHRLFSPRDSFTETPLSDTALLLASSFPSIDEEISLLKAVRESCGDIPIIVKFHPVHRYDERRESLAACASMVYGGSGNPVCRIFVSYGSFMEFDYRRRGIPTVSIARSGSVEAAVDEIRSCFAHSVSQEQTVR